MSKQKEPWDRLEVEFQRLLLDMKQYVLKHPNETERQQCVTWIKKLCDPAACGLDVTGRRNRNLYARLLLKLLKKGNLDSPFTSKPKPGSLQTLPSYLLTYYDDLLIGQSVENSNAGLADGLTGALGGSNDDGPAISLPKDRISSTPISAHHRRRLYEDKTPPRPMSSSPLKQSPRHDARTVDVGLKADMSPDDSDLEARLNSWNLGIENPWHLQEKPIPLSPIFNASFWRNNTSSDEEHVRSREANMKIRLLEAKHQEEKMKIQQRHDADVEKANMKIRLLEAKHQEEKMKIQQRHDADVEKILDRKNGEIEEMKRLYQTKQGEMEEMIHKLDKNVQSVVQESYVIRDSKEKQIAELKKMEKQMEQEKFELQRKHTEDTQELLKDTNIKLAKMETEYNAQSQATDQMVHKLELRVKQQSVEVEKMTREKAQLEIHIASTRAELQEANKRNLNLQKEKQQQSEQHEQTVQKLLAKHETDLSHLHQEHALSTAKASEVMEDFEKTVAQLKQQLMESEHRRHQEVRDQGLKFRQEKEELQINCEKKVLAVRSEAEKERTEAKRKIAKLEDTFREMESQLERARESKMQQIQQADMALEQLKKQLELSSEKAYADIQHQMEKIEEDLNRSKSLREKQAKDFSQQVDALRQKHEQQMAEQHMQYKQERTRLQQQHSAEKDSLVQEHQREVSSLERQARAALQQHQQHTQEWRERDAQRISDLEAQVDQLRSDMELARSDLERSHQQEKDAAQEKANRRLKQIEKEYGQKLAKSAQLIAELQTSACDSKEEALRRQQAMEKQSEEATARWDEEKKTIIHNADQASKALQEKVESLRRQLRHSEKKLADKEFETEERVLVVRKECQEKLKGLLPARTKQDLEDTISSLKLQVHFLQKTAEVLQGELNACRSRR